MRHKVLLCFDTSRKYINVHRLRKWLVEWHVQRLHPRHWWGLKEWRFKLRCLPGWKLLDGMSVNIEGWGGKGVEVCSRGAASVWWLKAETLAASNDCREGKWQVVTGWKEEGEANVSAKLRRKPHIETVWTFTPLLSAWQWQVLCHCILSVETNSVDRHSDMWLNLTV